MNLLKAMQEASDGARKHSHIPEPHSITPAVPLSNMRHSLHLDHPCLCNNTRDSVLLVAEGRTPQPEGIVAGIEIPRGSVLLPWTG